MASALPDVEPRDRPEDRSQRQRIILGELKKRSLWFIRLRWWVPPSIAAGVAVARLLRVEFSAGPVLAAAVFILASNLIFFQISRGLGEELSAADERRIARFTYWQVGLDYAAMFLLIHFTGGAASPLIFFFIFHIIFASILLPARSAYGFAALAAAGMFVIAFAEYHGLLLSHHALEFRGRHIDLADRPFHMAAELGFFTASVFITAFATTTIIARLHKRMVILAELSAAVAALNNQLNALYAMVQAILSTQRLDQVLQIVTSELVTVMGVTGISVKLLSADGKFLRFAAVNGLPENFVRDQVVEVSKSPLNRRVLAGEPFAIGGVSVSEVGEFSAGLVAARIQSLLFVPLSAGNRMIGVLSAYSERPEPFLPSDVEFFRQAAGLCAIALENARAYEAIANLVQQRSWFMMKVAHNLRAPLAAVITILEVARGGYRGELQPLQDEYLRRVERRARSMLALISELMTLARLRSEKAAIAWAEVDLARLAGRLEQTFADEAKAKGLALTIAAAAELPKIRAAEEMLEQLLEDLIGNSLKYTPAGGQVNVEFSRTTENTARIAVRDTGIGVPRPEQPKLFTEFFRAKNARAREDTGTGLGLAIVKEIVELHRGQIRVESEEGRGTVFFVELPISA